MAAAAAATVDVFEDPRCLSNFAEGFGFWLLAEHPDALCWERQWWPSAEHYFQAGKFDRLELQELVREAGDAAEAKALGRRLSPLRPDWEAVKRARIHRAMLEKLWTHEAPRNALLHTGSATLVNGNPVDSYFGTGHDGQGANVIGVELEQLRALFRTHPQRRRMSLKVGTIGEPFDPFPAQVDLTGSAPAEVAALAAELLRVPQGVIASVELVTEDGFEKTPVEEFADAASLEAFFSKHNEDCLVEVNIQDLAVVTLWDGPKDNHVAYAEVRHLCPTAASLRRRLSLLVPQLEYPGFGGEVTCVIDDDSDAAFAVSDASFPQLLAAASAGQDVVVRAEYAEWPEPQAPLREPPTDLDSPRVLCGEHTAFSEEELVDRIRGVIWGAALGDAVGLATEFMKKDQAASTYPDMAALAPSVRCQDRHRSRWQTGDWTDDTDQLVLFMEAIVAGGGLLNQKVLAESLLLWKAQGFPELGDTAGLGIGQTVSAVLEHPAYGVAPDVAAEIVWRQGGKCMAANGAVMRCAVGGLAYFWDEEAVRYNAAAGAGVTHADPRCLASCMAVCTVISRVLLGSDLSTLERRQQEVELAFSAASAVLKGDTDELHRHMSVPAGGLEALELGQGGIGYTLKPVGAGCWAFLHADCFREAIQQIVMEAGDADSNAVVAGAMLGARFGYAGLPRSWLDDVPAKQQSWMNEKVSRFLHLLGLKA